MHPNAMTGWETISCTRDHDSHSHHITAVDLGRRHGYGDLPDVPARFATRFEVAVWDWAELKGVEGGYCPQRDAVSETIDTHRIWEPSETILTLAACSSGRPGVFVDFGAQIGWFSALAASAGRFPLCFEADPACLVLLDDTMDRNGWEHACVNARIAADTPQLDPESLGRIVLAKVDVEGAEHHAVRMLTPHLDADLVDHILIEVSPCFDDYYPDLVADLLDRGLLCWMLPPKQSPPAVLEGPPAGLGAALHELPRAEVRDMVAGWWQENLWFSHPDAEWG